jgi:ketosteroid isomerase-like protein
MFRRAIPVSFLLATCIAACAHAPSAQTSAQELVDARFATFNRHDLDGIVKLYAPDAMLTSPGFCTPRQGQEGARRSYGDLFKTYPDISDEVVSYVAEGDHIAVQFVVHLGKYSAPLATFLTLKDGLIVRDDTYYDAQGQHCS